LGIGRHRVVIKLGKGGIRGIGTPLWLEQAGKGVSGSMGVSQL